jgi:hypothetical protein
VSFEIAKSSLNIQVGDTGKIDRGHAASDLIKEIFDIMAAFIATQLFLFLCR